MSLIFMTRPFNHLRIYRKRSRLTQKDISFLSGVEDHTEVCRYEACSRRPSIEFLLTYHLLFDVSIETFFREQREEMRQELLARLTELIDKLSTLKKRQAITARIRFLKTRLAELNTNTHHEQTNPLNTS